MRIYLMLRKFPFTSESKLMIIRDAISLILIRAMQPTTKLELWLTLSLQLILPGGSHVWIIWPRDQLTDYQRCLLMPLFVIAIYIIHTFPVSCSHIHLKPEEYGIYHMVGHRNVPVRQFSVVLNRAAVVHSHIRHPID